LGASLKITKIGISAGVVLPNRPGAYPNVGRLLAIVAGGDPLSIEIIPADQ
jgi:hypothetical protein